MKVSIKDFQIVKSASLEFIPGLTVIQGESNNGKTALFRAVKSCIYNEPGTTNVRAGCKNYMVGIEHNGHKVIFQKGENSLYMIDGQQYNKIGKSQVPEVAKALGIQALSINDNTEKINFWDQMEKPFLLDRNSSELFRFIVDSGEDDNLNNTLRSMVSDKNKLNTDKNLKEGAIATLKQQIDAAENLLAGSDDKIQLCENIISYGPHISKLLTINTTITNINNTANTIEANKTEINEKRAILNEIDERMNTLSYNISKKAQLNDIIKLITEKKTTLDVLNADLNNKIDFKAVSQGIEVDITNMTKLGEIVRKVNEIRSNLDGTSVARIEFTIGQDDINRADTLKRVLDRISYLRNNIDIISNELSNMAKDVAPFIEELNNIEVCPYCGNKLTEGGKHND